MGIIANIYRISNYPDCSNDGISNNFEEVCVVNCNGPFDFNEDRPPVILEKGQAWVKGEENVKAYPCLTICLLLRRPQNSASPRRVG